MDKVFVFSDGACRGNPGVGAYGTVVRTPKGEQEFTEGFSDTTNNRMELLGVIVGLESLAPEQEVEVVTDSKYLIDGITKWIHGWKKNGWKTASKAPVKNKDLWQRLDAALGGHKASFTWVKGHSGHPENERCDLLCNITMDEMGA